MKKDGAGGARVQNILADGSQRENLGGCAERADRLPELTRRLIVHFARLAGEGESGKAESSGAESGKAESCGAGGG